MNKNELVLDSEKDPSSPNISTEKELSRLIINDGPFQPPSKSSVGTESTLSSATGDISDSVGGSTFQHSAELLWNQGGRGDASVHHDSKTKHNQFPLKSANLDTLSPMDHVSDAPWHYYFHSQLPVAYSFLESSEIIRQKLSGQLAAEKKLSQPPNPYDDSSAISTWSSCKKVPENTWADSHVSSSHLSTTASSKVAPTENTLQNQKNEGTDRGQSTNVVNQSTYFGATKTHPNYDKKQTQSHSKVSESNKRPPLAQTGSSSSVSTFSDLASNAHNNQFGPGVRAKLNTVLPSLIQTIPLSGSRTIFITEYGCMNSRAVHLFRTIIEKFVTRVMEKELNDPSFQKKKQLEPQRASRNGFPEETADIVNFMVIHEDSNQSEMRSFQHMLETHPDSYLDPLWQSSHSPSLQHAIFSTLATRPFGSRIVPPDSLHLGFSLMDMHWTHAPTNNVSIASMAHAELTMSLNARAREFRRGGIFILAFVARSEVTAVDENGAKNSKSDVRSELGASAVEAKRVSNSPAAISEQDGSRLASIQGPIMEPNPRDIWATMSDMIVPCLQRLVSCGMMKVDVARQMLTLPMHPRSVSQTLRVLEKFNNVWSLDWSCGLGKSDLNEIVTDTGGVVTLQSEPNALRLPQPAWLALKAGKITHAAYHEHVIHMFKNLYEGHFRVVLRERGQLSKGAVEFILDSLWDVLRSRIDEPESFPLANCELEVQLLALRRL